jgi:alcohol dehydrogenase class IV
LLDQGLKRPLIVTDRALGALPVLAEFRSHLAGLDVAVFSGVFGNPTCSQVMDGAAAYKAHNADCIIGFRRRRGAGRGQGGRRGRHA